MVYNGKKKIKSIKQKKKKVQKINILRFKK